MSTRSQGKTDHGDRKRSPILWIAVLWLGLDVGWLLRDLMNWSSGWRPVAMASTIVAAASAIVAIAVGFQLLSGIRSAHLGRK